MTSRLVRAAALALAAAPTAPALAQSPWPNRPVRVFVGFPPGGSLDVMTRLACEQMQNRLGQSFVVENRTGEPIVTTAVPSVSPGEAARHFMKIECFCFQEQPLAPGERKLMPVQFYVDPELPARFKNLTLSYRLYRSVGQTASR